MMSLSLAAMELLFPKVFMSLFLAWPNGITTPPKKKRGKIPPPHPPPKRKRPDPSYCSLGSGPTLRKRIIITFQKMNTFLNLKKYIYFHHLL
jgi:hypothetical protein